MRAAITALSILILLSRSAMGGSVITTNLPANNAMLWGARGMGKSSLVKATHAVATQENPGCLVLIEIHREDIRTLPELLNLLRPESRRCLILCDDLSFEKEDADYKAKLAEMKRQRELRSTSSTRQSIGGTSDVSVLRLA